MDYSTLSDDELLALKKRDYSKLSDKTLLALKGTSNSDTQPSTLDRLSEIDKKYILNPMSKVGEFLNKYGKPAGLDTTPQSMLEKVPGMISRKFGQAGQMVAEQMGRENQVNPQIGGHELAGAVGTAISMAPDIAQAGLNPMEGEPNQVPESAIDPAQRALGFTKRHLKTPWARQTAEEAARVALENKVIPNMGNAETMWDRTEALQRKSINDMNDVFSQANEWKQTGTIRRGAKGFAQKAASESQPLQINMDAQELPLKTPAVTQENSVGQSVDIGSQPESANPQPFNGRVVNEPVFENTEKIVDPKRMIRSLNGLRPKFRGGLYDADHSVIDTAIETVKAHGLDDLTLSEANALKSKIQSSVPYGSPGHDLAKAAAAKVRIVVDGALDDLAQRLGNPDLVEKFKNAKRAYGASERMKDGLNNLLSAQQGNNVITPTAAIYGAGQVAAGNPQGALATIGAVQLMKKSGSAFHANMLNNLANAGKTSVAFSNPINASMALENLARKRSRK